MILWRGNRLELRRRRATSRCGLTLPLTVQFIIAMLAYALNERMARKAEYLREENHE